MRMTLVAFGTRGDVQPVLALGNGLQAAGQSVRVIAGRNFEAWVRSHGFEFVPSVDMEALMQSEQGVQWAQRSDSPLAQLRMMKQLLRLHADEMLAPLLDCRQDTDLFISGFVSAPFAQSVGEATGIPCVNAVLQPYQPTRSGAASLAAVRPATHSLLNLLAGYLGERLIWSISADTVNRLRRALGLSPHNALSYRRAARQTRTVYGFSPRVVPRPDDWPAHATITGYWFLNEHTGWQPPEALTAFLESGAPPVYVGFGSMSTRDPAATARLIVEAVEAAGQRAIVGSGWSGLNGFTPPSSVFVVDHVPHAWLFERVAAVVHHGGAGTTGAGLRAGRPTMIVPHMADQPYWGRRVHELGVGVAPVPRHKLTVDSLADGITRLTSDATLQANAAALGTHIRVERGVANAVQYILQTSANSARNPR